MRNRLSLLAVILLGSVAGNLAANCAIDYLDPTTNQADPRYHTLRDELRRTTTELHELRAETLAEQRVIDLPEDGDKWWTVLLVSKEWKSKPEERRIEAAFHSEPPLVSLKHQTQFRLITSDSPQFPKWRPTVDALPCLVVERANGEVIYRESGPQLARHPDALVRAIRKEVARHCPDGRCLPIHPTPDTTPPPKEEIPPVLKVDSAETPLKKPSPLPVLLVVAICFAIGFAHKFRQAAA